MLELSTGRRLRLNMTSFDFTPQDATWRSRLDRLDPVRYANSRNSLTGEVSGLSPYFTHGFLSLREAVDSIRQRARLRPDDKLFAEFAWRAFFHHVWSHQGNAIFRDLRPTLPGVKYAAVLPQDIREGRTGLPVIDQAVATLYETGYLHNHARMWLASYVVHLRHVHWKAGADWLYGHLLDGDLASNHLSWQWVASTFSTKPYLFNAENVAKYAPRVWACKGTPLDTSYEALELMARGQDEQGRQAFAALASAPGREAFAIPEPRLLKAPPPALVEGLFTTAAVVGEWLTRETLQGPVVLELVHPWALRSSSWVRPAPNQRLLRLGVVHVPGHEQWPWSERRWRFVLERMREVCDAVFVGGLPALKAVLPADLALYADEDLGNAETFAGLSALKPRWVGAPALLSEPPRFCGSFSKYFREAAEAKPTFQP